MLKKRKYTHFNPKISNPRKMDKKSTRCVSAKCSLVYIRSAIAMLALTLALPLLLLTAPALAQLSSGAPAYFGIDGDLKNDYRLTGSFTAAGTHDWFKMNSGTGAGVIDTTNTSAYKNSLAAGNNITFSKGLAVPRYSNVNNYLLLDARYGRDYFGTGSGAGSDLTTFVGGSKNGSNPSAWATVPTGASVANKADIIDAYVHMRRNGTVVSGTTPSNLFAYVGISTTSAVGNRFFDAEFFCSRLDYNTSTGAFSNSGSALTGGHTAWKFNPDGSVNKSGDLSISFDFQSSTVNEIYALVWVSQADYLAVSPKNFDFVAGEYYGVTGGYGYARIKAKSGTVSMYGVMNTSVISSTPWGTTAQTLGSSTNNYYSMNYDIGQFGEAAIDLTALGIDSALANFNACAPPFTRVLFKSRSSSSFTSSLQDFAGPYEFLDAPVPFSAINTPAKLTCSNTAVTLSAFSPEDGNYYYWTSADGNSMNNSQSSSINVTKPGKYYLNSSAFVGCSETKDSVTVLQDIFKPKATAFASNMLSTATPSATLLGGDTVASKYNNSNGSYQGLTWSWSGANGFTSGLQNAATSVAGIYTLIVTEVSNGCKDTAMANVVSQQFGVLAQSRVSFFATRQMQNKVNLTWTLNEKSVSSIELYRSTDGNIFEKITSFDTDVTALFYKNAYIDDISRTNSNEVLYKLKWITSVGKAEFSKIEAVKINENKTHGLSIFPNPVASCTTITFNSTIEKNTLIQFVDIAGKVVLQKSIRVREGLNSIPISGLSTLSNGLYNVRMSIGTKTLKAGMLKVD